MPSHIDEERVLQLINIEKDVDGFSPLNIGRLAQKGREPLFVPCTPYGCIYLLEQSGVKIEGAHAVVLGRSNIVGMPAALLLIGRNATVTVCHSRTRDLAGICRRADIVVAAIGRPAAITPDMVKPGATVVDVGINRIEDRAVFDRLFAGDAAREKQFAEKGSTLCGDVDPRVAEVAGALTPVPGGVGPLTIAMLMANTVRAARLRRAIHVGGGTVATPKPYIPFFSIMRAVRTTPGRPSCRLMGKTRTLHVQRAFLVGRCGSPRKPRSM
jgi:methylenetetrahydrofolate dehydrogenase (NADP+)/methenyltetrahydrofolate cyclohydrolase